MRISALVLLAGLAFGQESPPAKPEPVAGGPPAPVVLENKGKPMVVPFECAEQDMQLAGLACTEEAPCPVYLELDAVAAAGDHLFAAGNLHSSAVTLFSILLASEDGGRTWREPPERVRFAGLDKLQFLDAETGWAAGEKLSPLPQDPFLLLTTDGGKSWRPRTVFSESADNKLGAIQQFAFAARDSGSLIVDRGSGADGDRYELYESPDAGESWSFRQSSQKPLTLRRPATPSTTWRVRADSRTKAFHVERRQGERWTSVASFAVTIGACKP
jgi:hypothetical protein